MENFQEHTSVLIFDEANALKKSLKVLKKQLPLVDITGVSSLANLKKSVFEGEYDIVVLELDDVNIEFIYQLKLLENCPALLAIIRNTNEYLIEDAYKAGCYRCIVKDERWLDELSAAIRYLLRIERLEKENRKLIAKLTEANSLLSEKNKRLSDFTGTVAHDIRGPLGGINMKLEYMCDIYKDDIDPKLSKLLLSTYEASERLLGVVQAMYEFAKIGVKANQMEYIELGDLVREVKQDLNLDANQKVSVKIEDLPKVWGNAPLLRKVFINLINNAIKYCDKDIAEIKIGFEKTEQKKIGKFGIFYVEDNGSGIPKEDIGDLFVMFRRGKDAEKKCDGIGIGLSVVRQIIELHFGNVDVESEVGKGTKFVFSLPMEDISIEHFG